ncbi:MAG: Hydrolase, alpha/beta fold family, partial [uncultured Rubrobacteraceae bacterium]
GGVTGGWGGERSPVGAGRDPLPGCRGWSDASVRARLAGERCAVAGRGPGSLRAVQVRGPGLAARRARRTDGLRGGSEPAGRRPDRRGLHGCAGPARRDPRRQRHGRGHLPDRGDRAPGEDRPPGPHQLRRVRGLPAVATRHLSARSPSPRLPLRRGGGLDAEGPFRPAVVAQARRQTADGRGHARRLLRGRDEQPGGQAGSDAFPPEDIQEGYPGGCQAVPGLPEPGLDRLGQRRPLLSLAVCLASPKRLPGRQAAVSLGVPRVRARGSARGPGRAHSRFRPAQEQSRDQSM